MEHETISAVSFRMGLCALYRSAGSSTGFQVLSRYTFEVLAWDFGYIAVVIVIVNVISILILAGNVSKDEN